MRILIVSSFLAFRETRSGGSRRMYGIARSLEDGHDLSVICFDGSGERPQWNGRSCFRRFLLLAEDRGPGRWKWAHPLDFRRLMAARRKALAGFLGREPFDLRKIRKEIRYRQVLRYYRGFLGKIDVFFLSTETEIREVHRRFPGVATARLPIGMNVPSSRLPSPDSGAIAGFLGNFQHPPNLHAVSWYLDAVHPVLKARHPAYRFAIAGMNIPDSLRSLAASDPNLLLLGPLDDLEPYYRLISFSVNPIVSGKGVRTKVVESAAYGRAIVSTSLGADGTDPQQVNRADGKEAFADACSRLIISGSEEETILRRNRSIVESGFSDTAIRDRLLFSQGGASRCVICVPS